MGLDWALELVSELATEPGLVVVLDRELELATEPGLAMGLVLVLDRELVVVLDRELGQQLGMESVPVSEVPELAMGSGRALKELVQAWGTA